MKDCKLSLLYEYETSGYQRSPGCAAVRSFSDRVYGRAHVRDTSSGSSVHRPTLDRNRRGARSNYRHTFRNHARFAVACSADRDSSSGRVMFSGKSAKAALARTHSKTWRTFGVESASRSVVKCGTQFRFRPETNTVAKSGEFQFTHGFQMCVIICFL